MECNSCQCPPLLQPLRIVVEHLLRNCRKQIFGMHTNHLTALLTKAKRGQRKGLDASCLNVLVQERDVIELLELRVQVIQISVTGDEPGAHHLQGTVEHPGTCRTLR